MSFPDWAPSFAHGGPNVSGVVHLSFVDRRREWPLHLRHRSLDRCGQLMAGKRLHPLALADGARPGRDIRVLDAEALKPTPEVGAGGV
jgi:hypothetical protein